MSAQSVHIAKMADELHRLHLFRYLVLPSSSVGRYEQEYDISNLPVVRLPCLDLLSFSKDRGLRNPLLLSFLFRIKATTFFFSSLAFLLLSRADIWTREPAVAYIASKLGRTAVLDLHGLESFPKTSVLPAIKRSAACATVTRFLTRFVEACGGRAVFSPNAYDPREFNDAPANLFSTPTLVYVGRIRKDKGVSTLINATKHLPYLVYLIGGKYRSPEGNLIFMGMQPRSIVASALKSAYLIICPKEQAMFSQESCALKYVEALASGRPVVCSDFPRTLNCLHTVKFKAGDSNDLATKINNLLSNPKLANELGKKTKEAYAWNTWKNRILTICSKLGKKTL